jgi:acetyl-CoA synthetase
MQNRKPNGPSLSRRTKISEAEIAVHWPEEKYVAPSASFVSQANLTDATIFERFGEAHFPDCFKEYADLLEWYKPWRKVLDTSRPPFWRWFVGGRLNACHNCLDRHLAKHKNKAALHFVQEAEDEPIQHVTYQELSNKVNEFAALLRSFCGLKAGDRVTLYMPMVPELPVAMLACARLGVIHSQVFSGFSGKACAERIEDSESRILITMDGYYRAGKLIDHKANADIAVARTAEMGLGVEKVLVWQRHPGKKRHCLQAGRGPGFHRQRHPQGLSRQMGRSGRDGGRGSIVPDVYERHNRASQRLPAFDGRLSCLCGLDLEIHPGHSSRGCLLVHGRHRLDHGTFLHRLWSAGAGRFHGHL